MSRRAAPLLLTGLLLTGALAACANVPPAAPPGFSPAWQTVSLPADDILVRGLTHCADRWYAVGATPGTDQRPAAWTSTDARTWTAIELTPVSHYGERSLLSSVACHESSVVAVGAAIGGVHGNPRTSTWHHHPDGSWREQPAGPTLFGGAEAITVGPVAAGPAGFAIAGTWTGPDGRPAPAVWTAGPRQPWHRTSGTDGLDAAGAPGSATDVTALPDGRWLLAGERRPSALRPEAMSWLWADPRWQPLPPTTGPVESSSFALVAAGPTDTLAVGSDAGRAVSWQLAGEGWQRRGEVSAVRPLRFLALERSAAVAVVALGDGTGAQLFFSTNAGRRWDPLPPPVALTAGSAQTVALAVAGRRIVLAAGDDTGTRLWTAEIPSTPAS